jgi:hypothetical protein
MLARFALANRLAKSGVEPKFWFALLGGSFFEYAEAKGLADNFANVWSVLGSLGVATARKIVAQSIRRHDIDDVCPEVIDAWIEAFAKLAAASAIGNAGRRTFLGRALEHAGIVDAGKQESIARLYANHNAFTPALAAELAKDRSFGASEIADLSTSFQLADLTGGDFSVVAAIKDELEVRSPEQIRGLAKRSESEWLELVERKQRTGEITIPVSLNTAPGVHAPNATLYATTLTQKLRDAFPTTAFAGGLGRKLQNGGVAGLPRAAELHGFLDAHDDFELLHTHVDEYLERNTNPRFTRLAKDVGFRTEINAVQRVFKLTRSLEATITMRADGVHSAQKIYRLGEREFVRRYQARPGFSRNEARVVWRRAADTFAAALTIVGDLKSLDNEGLPLALQANAAALSTFPNWNNLFKSGDLCDCEQCRSVLSPAAYYADILMFLRDRDARNPAFSVKDILFRRRPDLGFLELDCENASTMLPYVDVVNEVLERVIAGDASDVELVGLTSLPAGAAAKVAVATALASAAIDAGTGFTLSQVDPTDPDRWMVHGDAATYLLEKRASGNFFAQLIPNIKADAAELRAYPAYVDPAAYAKLREARFPFALPFDLFGVEVRAGFEKFSLARWDLMGVLHGPAAPNNATAGEIAAEYFAIASDAGAAFDEKRLVVEEDLTDAGQQERWGEVGNGAWLTTVANVKTFLHKTGLEYTELLALLDLAFINPTGDLVIDHLDSSCDTDKKVLRGLTTAKLDRIHRFLRLWRKLAGWKMWELDLVLRHASLGAGTLDEPFLVKLFDFERLRRRLGASATVSRTCGLFGTLSHETHFTALHEKREDGFYQSLFLNKKLVQPIDDDFAVAAVDVTGPTTETISGHRPVILAALGIRDADLDVFVGLRRASNTNLYITDDLTLENLSFLFRHAWLARTLKVKAADWATLLKLRATDLAAFADPSSALALVDDLDRIKSSGLTLDELDWVLAANRAAKSATTETRAAAFLSGLRAELAGVTAKYDPARNDLLDPPSDVDGLAALLTSLLQQLHRDEAGAQFFIATLRDEVSLHADVSLPAGFDFPAAVKAAIPIRYDVSHAPATTLRFTGLMTAAQRTTLLDPAVVSVAGNSDYQRAIDELHQRPRLALKFLDPVFMAPLARLPASVDFKTLADPALALRIYYDAEKRALGVSGILEADERDVLVGLSADLSYRNAVRSLFDQPRLGVFGADQLWMQDADLAFPLRDPSPAADHLKDNLATAAKKAMAYLSKRESAETVVRLTSAELGLGDGLTRHLLGEYSILPATLLAHLTGPFATTSGVVDHATLPTTFDGWFWAARVAALWKKWSLTLAQIEYMVAIATRAQLLDYASLPLTSSAAGASLVRFTNTSRLLRLVGRLPEPSMTLLEVLANLVAGTYAAPADFAADLARVNDAWTAADLTTLIASLDRTYPDHYLLAETWERVERALFFTNSLAASVVTATPFAAAAMTEAHAKTLKSLLRAKLGSDGWLELGAEIQDVLRDRKRDALGAYVLTLPPPADVPTGKWENTNDLYAYYLLDVEMSACQLTSRLVQASGSVQLFVQRCFMGLEPDVVVEADGDDGDSAWRWWTWMRKYRVWEANHKVFLWPENYIEPELKVDRSPFFKDLETDLLQNEVNAANVEKAFATYLQKLDGVAQLEIAGFYQEDIADDTVVHVFGRTKGAEPHLYYYRRYDYRQWTPWEKVELDITGDYLVPAVVGGRLFLLWPIFTEVNDEAGNSSVSTPTAGKSGVPIQRAKKQLQLQMAVSDHRDGKWSPKRVSKDFVVSTSYEAEIVRKQYQFYPVDRTSIDGRFAVFCKGSSIDAGGTAVAWLPSRAFEISGCKGIPELANVYASFRHTVSPERDAVGGLTAFMKWAELPSRVDAPENDFSLESSWARLTDGPQLVELLEQTPWLFRMTPAWHLSYFDRLIQNGQLVFNASLAQREVGVPTGTWLPFFYDDKRRTFFVLPATFAWGRGEKTVSLLGNGRAYYPEVKAEIRKWHALYEGLVTNWIASIDLGSMSATERQQLVDFLVAQFPDDQLRELTVRYFMRYIHFVLGWIALALYQYRQFHFKNFYHPFVCDFAKLVEDPLQGIRGLMKRETQLQNSGFSFDDSYRPQLWVVEPTSDKFYPAEVVDFSEDGAYSSYNWELFFHAPLLIANALSQNQRFEEARDWYHYIFNPIGVESGIAGSSPMSKYWITKPFFETKDQQYLEQRIENILAMLAGDTTAPGYSSEAKLALEKQVLDWRRHPFEPHRIANYRRVAYQKTVLMKYLDNLLAWGDYLFRQDSMESINEATQLYVLAAELLGPRPKKIPARTKPALETFNELEHELDGFANALVEVENIVPPMSGGGTSASAAAPLPMLYFCLPHNEQMLGYWDTIADRLYKIRHCMNIDGVVRQLALFEPPIDPAALVKAVAAGIDIGAAVSDLASPLPHYRFNVVLQRANEVCSDVRALGAALLGALEKVDGEGLALLRQGLEVRLLEAVKAVRQNQIDEANEQLVGLQKTKELVTIRRDYYQNIEKISTGEQLQQDKLYQALVAQQTAQAINIAASVAHVVPSFDIGAAGFGGSPKASVMFGGPNVGSALQAAAGGFTVWSNSESYHANKAAIDAGHDRRWDDWKLQERLANKELEQVDKQIAAATLRVAIAQQELDNQLLQIENAKATDAFMRSKYTNQDLYRWQVAQISNIYFQSYKLAQDLAKRAERCYRFELGISNSNFISFGYWDSLKKGLLSGEKLQFDLRRMDAAYQELNRRELELTKNVSLALLDPLALVMLRETGRCFFRLPEETFDLDYPGHYFRRIKSVSVTLPCVAGPYTTVTATLRLLKSAIRVNTRGQYPRNTDDRGLPADDDRFAENNIPTKAIATSGAQNDSGLFELNFRDERYLPFEGAGAISEWSLELFNDATSVDFGRALRQFDYDSIPDAVLHVRYTARDDAGPFKNGAIAHLRDYFHQQDPARARLMLNLRREFPSAWSRFLKPVHPTTGNVFELEVSPDLFPQRDAEKTLAIAAITVVARCTSAGDYSVTATPPLPAASNTITLVRSHPHGDMHFARRDVSADAINVDSTVPPVTWKLRFRRPGGGDLIEDPATDHLEVEDVIVILDYRWV